MPISQTIPVSHTLLALLLGLTAAAANILGGLFILYRQWSRQYLKYFLALGAGFMLAAAILEILPESVVLAGNRAYSLSWRLKAADARFAASGVLRFMTFSSCEPGHRLPYCGVWLLEER